MGGSDSRRNVKPITVARPCRVPTGFHFHDHEDLRAVFQAVKRTLMMSVMLTLISHAATWAVREVAFPLDEPLDLQGRAQAAALAGDVRRVDAAWTSPALRARQTADALKLSATVDPALRDIDFGSWAGHSLAEIEAMDPDGAAAWLTDCAAAPHGGESITDLQHRMAAWLENIGSTEGRIVAVTHPSVIRAVVVVALDAAPVSFWRIDVGPLCLVRLRGKAGRWTLVSFGVRKRGSINREISNDRSS
jgi:broad specificity phosphatase PhoE